MTTIFQKYATGIFSLAVLVLGAVATALHGVVTPASIIQLIILGLGGVVTYIVPLVPLKWAGAAKTGVQIIVAGLTIVVPYVVQGGITSDQVVLAVVAFISAAATEFGVQIRTDGPVAEPANAVPAEVPAEVLGVRNDGPDGLPVVH